jgi:activator of HSP90 ATPase
MKSSVSFVQNAGTLTRRRMVTVVSLALGGGIVSSLCPGGLNAQAMAQIPGTVSNPNKTLLHYEFDLKAKPQRVYDALLSSKDFAEFTGLPAQIDPNAGGEFSLFEGQIVGRNIELVSGQRIVQAWRPTDWEAGVYSIVRFELKPRGPEATVVLDHSGFPAGDASSLDKGWHEHYLDTLKKYFG